MSARAAQLAVVATLSLSACGGADEATPYPREVREDFVQTCVDNGATRAQCRCAIDRIERRVSYEEFERQRFKNGGGTVPVERYTDDIVGCA